MDRRRVRYGAGAATAAAGIIHLSVTGQHAAEALWLGVAFGLVGLAQLGLAAALVVGSGGRRVATSTSVLHVAVIVGWAASRTVGLPAGVDGWTRELPGTADLAATALEVAGVVLCVKLLHLRMRRASWRWAAAAVLTLTVLFGSAPAIRTLTGKPMLAPVHAHEDTPSPPRPSSPRRPHGKAPPWMKLST